MNFKVLIVLLGLLAVASASQDRAEIERDTSIPLPAGWARLNAASVPARELQLVFALKQKNLDILKSTLDTVSNPKNSKYGQYMTLEEIADLVAPSQKVIDDFVFFLKSNGIDNLYVTLSRDFIVAKTTTTVAERLFNVKYHLYRHKTGVTLPASVGPYSLPESFAEKVDFVSGLVGFPDLSVKQPIINKSMKDLPSKKIEPTQLRARYNVTTLCQNANNSVAVAEFQAQYYSPSDYEQFWKAYVPFAPFKAVDKVVGQNDPKSPGIEASLDIEYVTGVAPNCTAWFYSMKNFNFWQDLTTWSAGLNNASQVPWVHSISYGSQGDYPSDDYQTRLDAEFQKLGLRGVSILFASGDSGSGCGGESNANKCECTFYPSFPATCPHVTSVGATRFLKGNSGDEGAVQAFGSGGGFSLGPFKLQDYQTDAVNAYLKSNVTMPPSCAFVATGRATPDVSANGDVYFQVINGGSVVAVGGTSASSPTFTGVIALVNDYLLNNDKPTLGFMNPFLYQTASSSPDAFYDVVEGDNNVPDCCSGKGSLGGFNTAKGWDPVTGLGTPNFPGLQKAVAKIHKLQL